jgi:hypothetical protein
MWFAPQLFGLGWGAFPFDVRYLTMAPFFFGGLWLRRADLPIGWWVAPVFLAALALWSLTFKAPHSPWLAIYPVMTFASVALIPWLERLPLRAVIEVIGAESLFFYLHHPWLFNIARRTLYRWLDWPLAYGLALVLTVAILLAARPLLARVRVVALLVGLAPAPALGQILNPSSVVCQPRSYQTFNGPTGTS